jgi:aminoglycoside 2''-phosphotransferase
MGARQAKMNLNLISSVFPEPILTSQIHHGDDFTVIEVNHTWMFRFPRRPEAFSILEIEKQFLTEFAPLSPIPIPHFQFIGPGFVGYRKIEGLLFNPARYQELSKEKQKKVTEQIGTFLSALHTFPIELARQMGMTEGWNGWRKQAYQLFNSEIAPRLSQIALRNVNSCFEAFFSGVYNPVVIHGDFYPREHLFIDPQKEELCGIIDFGDLTLDDPAYDLKNILADFGEEMLRDVLDAYHGPADKNIIDRMRVAIKAEPLFEAAYDIHYGYPGRLTHHIRDIEALFGQ